MLAVSVLASMAAKPQCLVDIVAPVCNGSDRADRQSIGDSLMRQAQQLVRAVAVCRQLGAA